MNANKILAASILSSLILLFLWIQVSDVSNAAGSGQFSSTNAAIVKAFDAVSSAKQSGGNVSNLVTQLNTAISLAQEASTLNATNSSEASLLLDNASAIAQRVSTQAVSAGSAGASAKQILTEESLGGAVATILIAFLIYFYGGRIYRLLWFYAYRHYTVRRGGNS